MPINLESLDYKLQFIPIISSANAAVQLVSKIALQVFCNVANLAGLKVQFNNAVGVFLIQSTDKLNRWTVT